MSWKLVGVGMVAGSIWLTIPTAVHARTWHVTSDGTGDAPTIQAGIDSAQAGDEVLVGPGSYTWTSEGASGMSMLRLKAGVLLLSEGGSEATILDAESRGRVANADVAGHVTIRGFTLQRGLVEVARDFAGGAAVRTNNGVVLEMSDCKLQDNQTTSPILATDARGGAVYCERASFEGCQFSRNEVSPGSQGSAQGGGIFAQFASVSGCTFTANRANYGQSPAQGGAIQADSLTLVDTDFDGNVAYCSYGDAFGGAVCSQGPVVVTRCDFTGNSTQGWYGGYRSQGGALRAGTGGVTIQDCVFNGNAASGDPDYLCSGGAVYSEGAATIRGSVFVRNHASEGGGWSYGWGGAICCGDGSLVERCTLIGNWAGGADLGGGGGHIPGTGGIVIGGNVRQSIVMSTGGETAKGGVWSCCDCFDNEFTDPIPGTGNFSADPGFCDADPSASGNYTLHSNSPCAPGQHPPGSESCELIGAAGVGCESTAIKRTKWSDTKRLFR